MFRLAWFGAADARALLDTLGVLTVSCIPAGPRLRKLIH